MPKVNEKIKAQIKEQISIIDIAGEYGMTVVPKSRGTYSLREHDSVLIYPETNSFYRYSTGIGGDVLKFMTAFPDEPNMDGITFMKAYQMLAKRVDKSLKVKPQKREDTKDKYKTYKNSLPSKQNRAKHLMQQFHFDDNCKNAMAYLIQTRKIDPELIKKLIHENCIKQETTILYKNKASGEIYTKKPNDVNEFEQIQTKCVVFIGHDEHGMTASACKRSCSVTSSFKCEYEGTDYSYGWLCDPEVISCNAYLNNQIYKPDKELLCFESYIDMVSFMTLLKMQGSDYTKYAYLSCGSATKYMTVLATQERIGYKNITICFDNDRAGKEFTELLKESLEHKGVIVKTCVSKANDWNKELVNRVERIKRKDPSIKDTIRQAHFKNQNAKKSKTNITQKGIEHTISFMMNINERKE